MNRTAVPVRRTRQPTGVCVLSASNNTNSSQRQLDSPRSDQPVSYTTQSTAHPHPRKEQVWPAFRRSSSRSSSYAELALDLTTSHTPLNLQSHNNTPTTSAPWTTKHLKAPAAVPATTAATHLTRPESARARAPRHATTAASKAISPASALRLLRTRPATTVASLVIFLASARLPQLVVPVVVSAADPAARSATSAERLATLLAAALRVARTAADTVAVAAASAAGVVASVASHTVVDTAVARAARLATLAAVSAT